MSSSASPPARFATAVTLISSAWIAAAVPASAQDWTSPQVRDASARAWERPQSEAPAGARVKAGTQKRSYTQAESMRMGTEARRRAEARERGWDRKMKAVSGSICSGC